MADKERKPVLYLQAALRFLDASLLAAEAAMAAGFAMDTAALLKYAASLLARSPATHLHASLCMSCEAAAVQRWYSLQRVALRDSAARLEKAANAGEVPPVEAAKLFANVRKLAEMDDTWARAAKMRPS